MIFNYFLSFLFIYNIFITTTAEVTTNVEPLLFGYKWILAPSPEASHHSTCLAHSSSPTSLQHFIPWNITVYQHVLKSLDLQAKNSQGVIGCCQPTLWCMDGLCFTQSFTDRYYNSNPPQGTSWLPVYTCLPTNNTVHLKRSAMFQLQVKN